MCALVTGVQTCALPISFAEALHLRQPFAVAPVEHGKARAGREAQHRAQEVRLGMVEPHRLARRQRGLHVEAGGGLGTGTESSSRLTGPESARRLSPGSIRRTK